MDNLYGWWRQLGLGQLILGAVLVLQAAFHHVDAATTTQAATRRKILTNGQVAKSGRASPDNSAIVAELQNKISSFECCRNDVHAYKSVLNEVHRSAMEKVIDAIRRLKSHISAQGKRDRSNASPLLNEVVSTARQYNQKCVAKRVALENLMATVNQLMAACVSLLKESSAARQRAEKAEAAKAKTPPKRRLSTRGAGSTRIRASSVKGTVKS